MKISSSSLLKQDAKTPAFGRLITVGVAQVKAIVVAARTSLAVKKERSV